MSTIKKVLWSILGAHLVLIVFFGAFKFEKITIALYFGTWVGIGLSWFLCHKAPLLQRAKVIGGIFIVQILVFAGLDLAHMNDLFLEEAGFLSIGVWTGILIGALLTLIESLENRIEALELELAKKDRTADG
ncbi:MAG: hypothetical protein AXA67_05815 [Methylothermaceae bacteria B42]|nr:MAG: hypothetical protein AXA67_05815 [Methylothermaceae bacteria B42]HHJ38682.1 hypothetical protein [Methylothermaceae bacterium]